MTTEPTPRPSNPRPTAEQVRDRAHAICIAWGVDPFTASRTTWGAACGTARSDLLVEAARIMRHPAFAALTPEARLTIARDAMNTPA